MCTGCVGSLNEWTINGIALKVIPVIPFTTVFIGVMIVVVWPIHLN